MRATDIYADNAASLLERSKDLFRRDQENEYLSVLSLARNLINRPGITLEPLIPKFLAFKGGGIKGIAYVGVIQYLAEKGLLKEIKATAGTSAGAITATLLAVGCDYEYVKNKMMNTDFMDFLDDIIRKKVDSLVDELTGGIFSFIKGLKEIVDFVKNIRDPFYVFNLLCGFTGLCEGEAIRLYIEEIVFSQTKIPYCTFGELKNLISPNKPFKHLHVFSTLLGSSPQIAHFSSEDPRWANLIISDAVRASMSIPGVFKPHILHFKDPQGIRYPRPDLGSYADGGMIYNFPIEAFDQRRNPNTGERFETDSMPVYNEHTIGFNLMNEPVEVSSIALVGTLKDLIFDVLKVYYKAERLLRDLNTYTTRRIINIDVGTTSTLDFGINDKQKEKLAHAGFVAVQKYIADNGGDRLQPHVKDLSENRLPETLPPNKGYTETTTSTSLQTILKSIERTKEGTVTCVLKGPSAGGKTEKAIQFAHEHAHEFCLVWWIPCSSNSQKEMAYRALAKKLQIYLEEETFKQVTLAVNDKLESLSKTKDFKPWLLIFDDASGTLEIPHKGGIVIVTSQAGDIQFSDAGVQREATRTPQIALQPSAAEYPTFLRTVGYTDVALSQNLPSNWNFLDFIRFKNLEYSSFAACNPETLLKATLTKLKAENLHAYDLVILFAFLNPNQIDIFLIKEWINVKKLTDTQQSTLLDELIMKEFLRENVSQTEYALKPGVRKCLTGEVSDPRVRKELYQHACIVLCELTKRVDSTTENAAAKSQVVALNLEELRREAELWAEVDQSTRSKLLICSARWKLQTKTNISTAKQDFETALKLDTSLENDSQIRYEFALCLSLLGEYDHAIGHLTAVMASIKTSGLLNHELFMHAAIALGKVIVSLINILKLFERFKVRLSLLVTIRRSREN